MTNVAELRYEVQTKFRQESNCRNFISAASISIMYLPFLRRNGSNRGRTQEENIAPKIPFSSRGSAINPSNYTIPDTHSAIHPSNYTVPDTHSAIPPPISLPSQQNPAVHGNLWIPNTRSAIPPHISDQDQQTAGIHGNLWTPETHSAIPPPMSYPDQQTAGMYRNIWIPDTYSAIPPPISPHDQQLYDKLWLLASTTDEYVIFITLNDSHVKLIREKL